MTDQFMEQAENFAQAGDEARSFGHSKEYFSFERLVACGSR